MSQLRAAGFVIYRKLSNEIEYLLLQASYPPYHWTPPKGHVDPGESDMETAVRETEEEAGLTRNQLVITSFTKTLEYVVRGRPKSTIYWLAEMVNSDTPIKLSKEHKDMAWLPLDQACKQADYADMQTLLRECQDFIINSK